MAKPRSTRLAEIVREHQHEILTDWIARQKDSMSTRLGLMNDSELQRQSHDFLNVFVNGVDGGLSDIHAPSWHPAMELLARISDARAIKGFSPSETAMFVFSLKEPIFAQLRKSITDATSLADETWATTLVLDSLGLYTTETYQKAREGIINRQQQELLELSTPVVTLWQGVLALPLIGTLDSARTQVVMESLLQRIVDSGAAIAIIDITGVPTVDTVTAQHLLKTVAAARLMGADCIISGIRPQIAQTIVHLGVELGSVVTKSTLADAFAIALKRLGMAVQKLSSAPRRRDEDGPDGRAAADRGEV